MKGLNKANKKTPPDWVVSFFNMQRLAFVRNGQILQVIFAYFNEISCREQIYNVYG